MSNARKSKVKNFPMQIAYFVGRCFSKIYIFKLSVYLKSVFSKVYSGWLAGNFSHCGENLAIEYPFGGVGLKYISIGDNFISGARFRLEAHSNFAENVYSPKITIGNNVNINFDCHIGCINEIKIGNDVLIASKVLIIDHDHGDINLQSVKVAPMKRPLVSKGKISIGNNVWIGEGCVLMAGVDIGDNCIIGANSVVTKKFDANTVIAGNPAKIIKILE